MDDVKVQVVQKVDTNLQSAKVLQIDLGKKNLLIVDYKEGSMMPDPTFSRRIAEELQEWVRRENDPLFLIGCADDVEIRLEKIDSGQNLEQTAKLLIHSMEFQISRLAQKLEDMQNELNSIKGIKDG